MSNGCDDDERAEKFGKRKRRRRRRKKNEEKVEDNVTSPEKSKKGKEGERCFEKKAEK